MIELIIRIIASLIVSIYYVIRFRKYIYNRRNNNITGDNLIRWERVSLIDKYHLRERIFGGSRLRIKRDAKQYEIKYYYIAILQTIFFIIYSIFPKDIYEFVLAMICLIFVIKLLFDNIEKKKNPAKAVITGMLFILLAILYMLVSSGIFNITEYTIAKRSFSINNLVTSLDTYNIVSFAIILLIIIYSIIKKRTLSLFICLTCALTVVCGGFLQEGIQKQYILVNATVYLYIALLIMQIIYNIRALKKITFIR